MALWAYKDAQHWRCAFSTGGHFINRPICLYTYLIIYFIMVDGGINYITCKKFNFCWWCEILLCHTNSFLLRYLQLCTMQWFHSTLSEHTAEMLVIGNIWKCIKKWVLSACPSVSNDYTSDTNSQINSRLLFSFGEDGEGWCLLLPALSRLCSLSSIPPPSTKSWFRSMNQPLVLVFWTAIKPSVKALKHHLHPNPLIDRSVSLK